MEAISIKEREQQEDYRCTYRKKERRIIERIKLENECSIDITTDESTDIIKGKLRDVSPIGCSFTLEKSDKSEKIYVDSFVKLIFNNDLNYFALFGRVIWKKQISDTQISYGCQMPIFNKQIEEFVRQTTEENQMQ